MSLAKYDRCCLEAEGKNVLMQTIHLEHGKLVNVGRSTHTQVRDVSISRLQVSVTANYNVGEVIVKRIGRLPSYLDGLCMEKNLEYTARPNSFLELAENRYRYRIKFYEDNPGPSTSSAEMTVPEEVTWYESNNSMLVGSYGSAMENIKKLISEKKTFKIAGFDLDGTLINNKTLHTHSCGWEVWNSKVLTKLKSVVDESFTIVIFTNQASLKFKANIPTFKQKFESIAKTLKVPLIVLVATNYDFNRKPAPGMWFYLKDEILEGSDCCMENSFFVGDAAGRIKDWKPAKSKDFSIGDRLFARNLKLKFLTPEEYFLNEKPARFAEPNFHPWNYPNLPEIDSVGDIAYGLIEVIVLVGLPGSGKTTFAKTHLVPRGYVHSNSDTLGSIAKCINLLKESLQRGKKVVVDNTNLDVASRKRILEICKQMNVTARCFVMSASFDRCMHNNTFRILQKTDHAIISPMVMRASQAKFVQPTVAEGFSEIIEVPFVPVFKTPEEKTMYQYYLQVTKTK